MAASGYSWGDMAETAAGYVAAHRASRIRVGVGISREAVRLASARKCFLVIVIVMGIREMRNAGPVSHIITWECGQGDSASSVCFYSATYFSNSASIQLSN